MKRSKTDKPRRPRFLAVLAGVLAAAAPAVRFGLNGYKATMWFLLGAAAVCALLFFVFPMVVARWVVVGLTAAAAVALLAAEVPVLIASHGDEEVDVPYLVVLGAGVNGTVPSRSLKDRLTAAQAYLTAHEDTVAIVAGGQGAGEDISEAAAMRDWLVAHGIDEGRILMEDRSTSTQENLAFSFDMIRARGDSPADGVAIASSEYHLYRAKCKAAQLGATAYGIAGRTSSPSLRINYFLREAFAVWYMWVFG